MFKMIRIEPLHRLLQIWDDMYSIIYYFLLLWGIDLTVTSHILPVFEKRKNGGYALHYMSYS